MNKSTVTRTQKLNFEIDDLRAELARRDAQVLRLRSAAVRVHRHLVDLALCLSFAEETRELFRADVVTLARAMRFVDDGGGR